MKRFVSSSVLSAGLLVFIACGGGAAAKPTPPATAMPTPTLVPPTPTAMPVAPTSAVTPQARVSIDGHWEGATVYRRGDLTTMIDFETGEEGLKGTLDFPEIGREGLVLSKVSLEDSKVHFELSDFRTVFDGELKGDTISGEFMDPDGSGPFFLKRGDR